MHVTNGTNRGDVCFCFCFLDITKALMNLKWLIWAHLVTITIILLLIAFVSLGLILMLSKRHRKTARHGRHSCPVRVCDKGKVILFLGDHSPRMKKKKNSVPLHSCNENYHLSLLSSSSCFVWVFL